MKLYEDNNLEVTLDEQNNVLLLVKNNEISMNYFQDLSKSIPRVKVTDFMGLKKAFDISGVLSKIGEYKDMIEFHPSADEMSGHITINCTQEEIRNYGEDKIKADVIKILEEKGVTEGINLEDFEEEMYLSDKILVCQGIKPVDGVDAKIKYFEFSEKKPKIKSDGKVDNYDMNLIDTVQKGGWLGEKILATNGKEGRNIFGKSIPAKPGRDYMLKYDKKSVLEMPEGNKIILTAKYDGAVKVQEGKIGVDNHLMIDGNVDFKTGNINFDGFVTINGIVEDLFSVIATKDIIIKGPIGIGAVGVIQSLDGNVSVLGGINGKYRGKILAGKNVYIKYVNEAEIEAEGDINIGLYAFESTLKGEKIVLSPEKGRIVGGKIEAKHLVVANTLGNAMEKATKIKVLGFDRNQIKVELESIKFEFNETIFKANRLKRQLEIMEINKDTLSEKDLFAYKGMLLTYESILDEINMLNSKFKQVEEKLRTKGEGEVKILKSAYPKTILEIKNLQKIVKSVITGSFYVKDNALHLSDV